MTLDKISYCKITINNVYKYFSMHFEEISVVEKTNLLFFFFSFGQVLPQRIIYFGKI